MSKNNNVTNAINHENRQDSIKRHSQPDTAAGSTGASNAVMRDLAPGSDTLPPNLMNLTECPGLSDIHDYGFSVDSPDPELPIDAVRQDSAYSANDKAAPANNLFFLERSNPLSSKGD